MPDGCSSPDYIAKTIAPVRYMASFADERVAVRVEMISSDCSRCRCYSEIFVEPFEVCAKCWSILVMYAATKMVTFRKEE